jgi:hypothetical protein
MNSESDPIGSVTPIRGYAERERAEREQRLAKIARRSFATAFTDLLGSAARSDKRATVHEVRAVYLTEMRKELMRCEAHFGGVLPP